MSSVLSKKESFLKERKLRMIWEVSKDGGRMYLVGTAHFFPYSFKKSLIRYIREVDTVLIEGPLDEDAMGKVVESGSRNDTGSSLRTALDEQIMNKLTKHLTASFRCRSTFFRYYGHIMEKEANDSLVSTLTELRPWLAFFRIWYQFLRMRGWAYSMDKDAYRIAQEMNKSISYLEEIGEQIAALEQIPVENIARFLGTVDDWKEYTDTYVKIFLKGDLHKLMKKVVGFPTRCRAVIEDRDEVLFERMKPYIENGNSLACVGITHVQGILEMLEKESFSIRQVR